MLKKAHHIFSFGHVPSCENHFRDDSGLDGFGRKVEIVTLRCRHPVQSVRVVCECLALRYIGLENFGTVFT